MSLAPGHNHPVVFRRQPDSYTRPARKRDMSEKTYQRMRLVSELIWRPRKPTEAIGTYVTRLSSKVGMDPVAADRFLFGALYRKSV